MNHYILILSVVVILAIGQILFKLSADKLVKEDGVISLLLSAMNTHTILALFIYALGTALWIYTLSLMPLNRAYPFISLTFVIVPVISWFFLGETITWGYVGGLSAIIVGIVIISVQPH